MWRSTCRRDAALAAHDGPIDVGARVPTYWWGQEASAHGDRDCHALCLETPHPRRSLSTPSRPGWIWRRRSAVVQASRAMPSAANRSVVPQGDVSRGFARGTLCLRGWTFSRGVTHTAFTACRGALPS